MCHVWCMVYVDWWPMYDDLRRMIDVWCRMVVSDLWCCFVDGPQLLTVVWWLMHIDWCLVVYDCCMMFDDWCSMAKVGCVLSDYYVCCLILWWLLFFRLMIDMWWLMCGSWCCSVGDWFVLFAIFFLMFGVRCLVYVDCVFLMDGWCSATVD